MATIKGFKGLRYEVEDLGAVCCPPYDIIDPDGREKLTKQSPYNAIRLELPDTYESAAQLLAQWRRDGILSRESEDSIYVYKMDFEINHLQYTLKGFISQVKLADYSDGVVVPHENTLSGAKADRLELLKATGTQFSHVYSLYDDHDEKVRKILEKTASGEPTVWFTDCEKITHSLWAVSDKEIIAEIAKLMADKKLYIADGHHRYETALNYRNFLRSADKVSENSDYVSMMLVEMENPGLVVFPTHRIIHNRWCFNYDWCIEKFGEHFELCTYLNREKVERGLKEAYENGRTAFGFFVGGNNYTLMILRDNVDLGWFMPHLHESVRKLDVTVLQHLILERLLGIGDEQLRGGQDVTYTREPDVALAAVDGQRADCCFLLNPTRVKDIQKISSVGAVMPQKSTYFYPKLTTGLVFNLITEITG